jgi:CRP-like cAMP-binding protein
MKVPFVSSSAAATPAEAAVSAPESLLHATVRRHIRISEEELARFCQPFRAGALRKKEFLLQPGQVCAFEAFVTKGCLSLYALDARGHKRVLYFATEGWWITDIDSFTTQTPSRLYVEALEDSEFLLIRKPEKEQLYQELPVVERLFRLMTQKTHVVLQRRLLASFSASAPERYEEFLTTYPELAQRLTQQQIAAYLGISHEFVSKIRRRR